MATFARIQDGAVAELFTPPAGLGIAQCFAPGLEWVDCTATPAVAPGWTYDGGAFAAPVPPAPPAPSPTITASAYFGRFSADETNAIHAAALAQPPTAESLTLFNYLLLAAAASTVTLTDPQVVAGHAALVSLGLLTAARSTAILAP